MTKIRDAAKRGAVCSAVRTISCLSALLALALVVAPAASADLVIGKGGKRGGSFLPDYGICKSRILGKVEIGTHPPTVKGVNLRRGRRDITKVRFKTWFMSGEAVVAVSNWSNWLRVSDRGWFTWTGYTYFNQGWWQYNYYLDIRVEWWKNGRRRGWRDHRQDNYRYWDQYGVGPAGPFGSCTAYGPVAGNHP